MAVSEVVLGLIVDRPDHRRSLVRRAQELLRHERFFGLLDDLHPFEQVEGESRVAAPVRVADADVDAEIAESVDVALAWLQEQALIEPTAVRDDPGVRRMRGTVYTATRAGVAHFERWIGDASTLDPQGSELRRRLPLCSERQLPLLRELAGLQELVCFDRLEELRRSGERMTFARASTLEELWEAMTSFKEPLQLRSTVMWVRSMRQALDDMLAGRPIRLMDIDAPPGRDAQAAEGARRGARGRG